LGSGGTFLYVTPEQHGKDDRAKLAGPAIELDWNFGGASGRFTVATIASRIFPIAKDFVQGIIDEGLPKEDFHFSPYKTDRLKRRSETEVEFLTPGNREGLGTSNRLEENGHPIRGVAILLPFPPPNEETDLIMLTVRLSPDMDDLVSTIIKNVEVSQGKAM